MYGDMLPMWTVYDHPSDFPHNFVAREILVGPHTTICSPNMLLAPDLDSLRHLLSGLGLTPVARNPEDDPVIVETWL